MCFDINYHRPRNTAVIASLLAVPVAKAVEVQAARELVSSWALPGSVYDMVDVLAAEWVVLPNSEDKHESAMAVIYTAVQQQHCRGNS